ncbi:PHP domain-containing protein [Actinobacteria bacterium IMCC26256]|nr:PHP domain-containing protein [Actinobacteria bacterium IMCC26256]
MLIDLHAHTTPRSNCSSATLEELVESARSRGLDALCITEHDVRWPEGELEDASRLLKFPLIPGVELSTDVGHVLVFGPLERPLWLGYRFEQLVEEVARTGTAIVLPHPVRNVAGARAKAARHVEPSPETVAGWEHWSLVHAIEAMSTQTISAEHELTAAALRVAPMPSVGASDAHGPGLAGIFATDFSASIVDVEGLAAEIRAGHVRPVRFEG